MLSIDPGARLCSTPAGLIEWLVSDEGSWMSGQVLDTESGFVRWRAPARSPQT